MAKRLGNRRKIEKAHNYLETWLFFLMIGCLLELVARAQWVSPLYFPPISKDVSAFVRLTASGELPMELLKSFVRMGCGYALAAATMIPLGILMGISPRMFHLLDPAIEFLRPLPPPAIIPVAMLFLGIGDAMKIFVIFFACAFPMVLNTMDGARHIHPVFIATGRTFGLTRTRLIRRIVLPAALPQIMSGLRTSLPISLIVAILSEMIGSVDGIGHFILRMQRSFNIPEMYAGIMMLGMVGYCLNTGFMILEQTLLAWHKGWKSSGN